jgi:hypothetical protein
VPLKFGDDLLEDRFLKVARKAKKFLFPIGFNWEWE